MEQPKGKVCTKCKERKSLDMFDPDMRKEGKFKQRCRLCAWRQPKPRAVVNSDDTAYARRFIGQKCRRPACENLVTKPQMAYCCRGCAPYGNFRDEPSKKRKRTDSIYNKGQG